MLKDLHPTILSARRVEGTMTSLVLTPHKVTTNIPRMREKESRSSLPYKTHLSAIDGLENKQTRAEHTHTHAAGNSPVR